jgi:NAD(P)-dependent dehydrogenase (short-subunit alcohol dehydrogenase family)
MPNEFLPRNKSTIAVITGGTQGLGLAIAKRLALEGSPGIVISGRNSHKGENAAKEVQALGTDCLFVPADVSIVEYSGRNRNPAEIPRRRRRLAGQS